MSPPEASGSHRHLGCGIMSFTILGCQVVKLRSAAQSWFRRATNVIAAGLALAENISKARTPQAIISNHQSSAMFPSFPSAQKQITVGPPKLIVSYIALWTAASTLVASKQMPQEASSSRAIAR